MLSVASRWEGQGAFSSITMGRAVRIQWHHDGKGRVQGALSGITMDEAGCICPWVATVGGVVCGIQNFFYILYLICLVFFCFME